MAKQKFFRGDIVKVDDKMPDFMAHFKAGFKAVVVGSYDDLYPGFGGSNTPEYCLKDMSNGNETSWYYESQLKLVSKAKTKRTADARIAKLDKLLKEKLASGELISWEDVSRLSEPRSTLVAGQ